MGAILSNPLGGDASAASAATDDNSRVIKIHKTSEWQSHYDEWKQSTKLMVVDFSASWCGPCKFLEPAIKALADKYEDVVFVKIDVDELPVIDKEEDNTRFFFWVFKNKGRLQRGVWINRLWREEGDVAQQYNVQAMPTFVLLKDGNEVSRVLGAKKDELEKKISTSCAA